MTNGPISFLGNTLPTHPPYKKEKHALGSYFIKTIALSDETDGFAEIKAQRFAYSGVGSEAGTVRSLQHLAAQTPGRPSHCVSSLWHSQYTCQPLLSCHLQEARDETGAELWRKRNLGSNPSPAQLSPHSLYDLGEVAIPF